MEFFLSFLSTTMLCLSISGLVYWVVVFARVRRTLSDRPTIRDGLSAAPPVGEAGSVSIIIPAHNEERVIEASVQALRQQRWPDLEIIYVLDRCTDRTEALLRSHAAADERIRIVINDHCPEGWAGKCHAAWIGARHATGRWLLFSDADTTFAPDLVRASVSIASARGWGLLSLLSTLTCEHLFERIAQPVATIVLMRLFPMYRMFADKRARPFANGQFMLFERQWYERIGGHEGVKDDLLEDLAFARSLHSAGGKQGVLLADGMLRCSMYDSWSAFAAGWSRIFIEACRRKPRRLRKIGGRLMLGGAGLPIVHVGTLLTAWLAGWLDSPWGLALIPAVVISALTFQLVPLGMMYALSGTPVKAVLGYPVGCWLVGRIILRGANDLVSGRPVAWGGKEYVLEPR